MPESSESDQIVPVPAEVLRDTIALVAFAAARDDSRPILTGVWVSYQEGILTMAAADGFRLSVRSVPVDTDYHGSFNFVIPARTLSELARISADEEQNIYMILPEERSQVLFNMTNIDVMSQTIDGTFPDFKQIIPTDLTTRTIVDTQDFLRACKRADIFARESNNTVRLSIEPRDGMAGTVRVTATSAETGDNEVVIDASIEGDSVEVAFNVRYLIDVLSVIKQDQVIISTSRSDKPGVLQPVGDSSFTHVIMPMHIGR